MWRSVLPIVMSVERTGRQAFVFVFPCPLSLALALALALGRETVGSGSKARLILFFLGADNDVVYTLFFLKQNKKSHRLGGLFLFSGSCCVGVKESRTLIVLWSCLN